MNMECDKTDSFQKSSDSCIQALALNYLKCKRLAKKNAHDLTGNYVNEDGKCIIERNGQQFLIIFITIIIIIDISFSCYSSVASRHEKLKAAYN